MPKNKNLYHYCSNEAFHSIVSSQQIWLTSLSLSNDSREGKVILDALAQLAEDDGQDKETIKQMLDRIHLNKIVEGLGFCLSEKKDLLSQWRGYADDAHGVSIGFSKEYLELLASYPKNKDAKGWPDGPGFNVQKAVYSFEKQKKILEPTYKDMKKLIAEGALNLSPNLTLLSLLMTEEDREENEKRHKKAVNDYSLAALSLLGKLFTFKSKAFEEELEWRLISFLIKPSADECLFLPCSDKIKPYRSFELKDHSTAPIKEVIIGPKNNTPTYVIKKLLDQNGFYDVKISSSEASYR